MPVLIHRSVNTRRGAIYQGSADDVLKHDGRYSLIVLCADEFQPQAKLLVGPGDGVEIVYAPNDDSEKPLTREQLSLALRAARLTARAYKEGKTILVSCMAGRNRSGFVVALTLHLLYGMDGRKATAFVRAKVANALTNDHFERFLSKIPARVPAHRRAC